MDTTKTTTETSSSDIVETPVVAVVTPSPSVVPSYHLISSNKRKDISLWVLTGGGIAMTIFAAACLYLLQHFNSEPIIALSMKYTFWLGLSAMASIVILFTGIAGLLVKRTLNISKNGVVIEDHGSTDKQS